MQVDPVSNTGAAAAALGPHTAHRKLPEATDQAVFSAADRLRSALENQPSARKEAVDRGRELVADVQYPPSELINGISRLLAEHMLKL